MIKRRLEVHLDEEDATKFETAYQAVVAAADVHDPPSRAEYASALLVEMIRLMAAQAEARDRADRMVLTPDELVREASR